MISSESDRIQVLISDIERATGSIFFIIAADIFRNSNYRSMESGLANFKLAQLKISLALKKETEGKTINDNDISRIISKFTDDEYEAMEKLDKFSKIDSLNSESITTLLMNKDDQIYRLIKEWYEENMEAVRREKYFLGFTEEHFFPHLPL